MTTDDLQVLLDSPVGRVIEVNDAEPAGERLAAAGWSVHRLAGIADRDQFYRAVAAELELPDWFGHNLDALWDVLRDIGRRTALIVDWAGFAAHDADYAARVRSVLAERAATLPAFAAVLVVGPGGPPRRSV